MNKQAKDSTHVALRSQKSFLDQSIAMGFIFLHSCFMGFIFLWFWLWVHLISFVLASVLVSASVSEVWSRSRKRAGSGLERMELDLGLRLGQNGARSRPPSWPKWSSISASISAGGGFFFSFLFLLLGCGFDNDLIMVGLWVVACGGCGLWTWWWC